MGPVKEVVSITVCKRGKIGKARGVIVAGKEYKIGETLSVEKSEANYLVASGKCEFAKEPAKK